MMSLKTGKEAKKLLGSFKTLVLKNYIHISYQIRLDVICTIHIMPKLLPDGLACEKFVRTRRNSLCELLMKHKNETTVCLFLEPAGFVIFAVFLSTPNLC